MPKGWFSTQPAVGKWFTKSSSDSSQLLLNSEYWSPYGETIVPLELTRPPANDHSDTFSRFQAPLSLFLDWSETHRAGNKDGLYLAQAPLSDLPQGLRDDLPTPDIVAHAGRGDIYDTNIWIGLAPTYTPLHRDPNPNLFVQIAGSKSIRLFRPDIGNAVFRRVQAQLGRQGSAHFRGEEMMQGAERKLLEDAVWHDDALPGYAVDLESGDGLFIPKGWWHSIKGVGSGITGSVNWWFR